VRASGHEIPAGAERLLAHRPREIDALNFGLARDYNGRCTLRFDDTNPAKEDAAYIAAIIDDIRWLGYEWDAIAFASDYFDKLYAFAVELIENGLAYIDAQDGDAIRAGRGTLTEAGIDSPYRDRPVAENLKLFAAMKNGEFADGAMVLRAKIDMASPNLNLRDPVLYRIRRHRHPRTGDAWRIYPLYDFAHGQSDAIEGVTHSLCTLEFEDHRPLYDWFIERLSVPARPRQIEFSRLNLNYTVMSKRSLARLIASGDVGGWDDPRMPTIRGLRRRGYTPVAIRNFVAGVGITRKDNLIDMSQLEHCARADLNPTAPRASRCWSRSNSSSTTIRPARANSSTRRIIRPMTVWGRVEFHCRARFISSATTTWTTRRRSSIASRRGGR